jgi:hypothetical protein
MFSLVVCDVFPSGEFAGKPAGSSPADGRPQGAIPRQKRRREEPVRLLRGRRIYPVDPGERIHYNGTRGNLADARIPVHGLIGSVLIVPQHFRGKTSFLASLRSLSERHSMHVSSHPVSLRAQGRA